MALHSERLIWTQKKKILYPKRKSKKNTRSWKRKGRIFRQGRKNFQDEVERYKELKQSTDEEIEKLEKRKEELENLQGASSKMLAELVPNFISENQELKNFFNMLSSTGEYEGQGSASGLTAQNVGFLSRNR